MKMNLIRMLLFVLSLLGVAVTPVYTQVTGTWSDTAPASSLWSDSSSWVGGVIPLSAGDKAIFNQNSVPLLDWVTELNVVVNLESLTLLSGGDRTALYLVDAGNLVFSGANVLTAGVFNQSSERLFFDTYSISGGTLITISGSATASGGTGVAEYYVRAVGTQPAEMLFSDTATAGNARIETIGERNFQPVAGTATFSGNSTAGTAAIFNSGSQRDSGGRGGQTFFIDNAKAGSATILNLSSSVAGGFGGYLVFNTSASAENAEITNKASTLTGAGSGYTAFFDNAVAGSATITNEGSTVTDGGYGYTEFHNNSSADNAYIYNNGSLIDQPYGGGYTVFLNASTAGSGFLINDAAQVAFGAAGITRFTSDSSAGTAVFSNRGGALADADGGATIFEGNAFAVNATITNEGGDATLSGGGSTSFEQNSRAGGSQIRNKAAGAVDAGGGWTQFIGNSKAGTAVILNEGGVVADGNGGGLYFRNNASAEGSTITNVAGVVAGAKVATTYFYDSSTAGTAVITNLGATLANEEGSEAIFTDNSTAGSSSITNKASSVADADGAVTVFNQNATAGSATIINEGATAAGATSGQVVFFNNASAQNARLIATNGSGGNGGYITFAGTSSGGTAAVMVTGNAGLNIEPHTGGTVQIGSLEGTGAVFLGTNKLKVGANHSSTVFSGNITGLATGSFAKIGTGTLFLNGVNSYTGTTDVEAGKLVVNGSLATSLVNVHQGTELGGSGSIAGAVNVANGAILSPGNSPGVLSVGSLLLNPSSVLSFELGTPGVPSASDRIDVLGHLTLDGLLNIVDAGGFGTGTYRLINYGGSLVNNGLTINDVPAGVNPGDLLLDVSKNGQVNLLYNPAVSGGLQYWDGAYSIANGSINGGDGVWAMNGTNWTNVQGLINSKWAAQTAVFAARPGTVSLGSDVSFEKLIFDVSGYRIVSPLGYKLLAPGNATVQVNRGRATIAAPMTVNGTLHKTGGGLLDLRAPVTAGATLIQSGKMAVNSVLHSPYVNVSHGATLMGNGLIIGNVFNSGTVAPGNSIGTLAIEGNYTQRHNGTLQIEVGSVNNHDMLIVSGTAKLAGTLEIASLGYNAAYGDQVPFLIAGDITGKFNTIEMPNPDRFRGRFVDHGNVGVLLVAPTSYTLVARNQNQTNVARALDEWIGIEEGDIGKVTLALDYLRADQYPQAFNAIAPAYYEAALSTGTELSQSHQQLIHMYISARRLVDRLAKEATPAPVSNASAKGGKNAKQVIDPISPDYTPDYRWSAWTQASGLFSSGGMSLAPGEDFESGTYIVGADYLVADNLAVGLFASYQEGWGDYDHSGDIDVESTRFGGYVTFETQTGFYANAVIGGGQAGFDVQRPIQWATLSRVADSEPDGWEFFTGISLGQDIKRGNWTFGPQLTVQYSKLELGEFNETGANVLNLRVHDANSESLRSYLGGRVAYTHKVSDKLTVIPEIRAFWQHEFLGGDSFSSSLDSGFGGRFNYKTKGADKDSVLLGAGLGFLIGERVYMNVYYNVDLGRNGDENHTISINATVKF